MHYKIHLSLTCYQFRIYREVPANSTGKSPQILPSKIFEYGAFNKPIIAGVSGFSRVFLENNVKNTITFNPGNIEELVTNLNDYTYVNYERECFKKKFSRLAINKEMAKSIYKLI